MSEASETFPVKSGGDAKIVVAKRRAVIREKIEEADADPHCSLTDAEVDNHLARRLEQSQTASK